MFLHMLVLGIYRNLVMIHIESYLFSWLFPDWRYILFGLMYLFRSLFGLLMCLLILWFCMLFFMDFSRPSSCNPFFHIICLYAFTGVDGRVGNKGIINRLYLDFLWFLMPALHNLKFFLLHMKIWWRVPKILVIEW